MSTSGIEKIIDVTKRDKIAVGSIPGGLGDVTVIDFLLPAGLFASVLFTTTPAQKDLSLWNFKWSMFVDTDDVAHAWRDGGSLTSDQRKLRILADKVDWATSSDLLNRPVHNIVIENYDTSDHHIYLKYKAYTFASVTGSGAAA